MKSTVFIAAGCVSAALMASSGVFAQGTQADTKYVTVDGEVVRYEAGQVIVIRGADNKEISYTLAPSVAVPVEVKIGRRVTLYTEPGTDGKAQLVSRVTRRPASLPRVTSSARPRTPGTCLPARPPSPPPRTCRGRSMPTKRARPLP